jgi:hypothetical protein
MLALKSDTLGERKFDVYRREPNGFVHRIGVIMATNKIQADTKVNMMYKRSLTAGATVWAIDRSEGLNDD